MVVVLTAEVVVAEVLELAGGGTMKFNSGGRDSGN